MTSVPIGTEVEFSRSREQAAEKFGLGIGTVARGVKVIKDGVDELKAAVQQGRVSVSAAADVASRPNEEQRQIVAKGEKEILEAARAGRLASSYHFRVVFIVIRHDAKAAARGAPLLIVGALVDHAVAVAIRTSLHGPPPARRRS